MNETNIVIVDEEPSEMDRFFNTVSEVRQNFVNIKQLLEQVKSNHDILLTKPRTEALQQETDQIIQQIKGKALKINHTIKRMGEEISSMEASPDVNATDVRIRKAQHNSLVQDFRDTMYECNTIAEEYRAKSKERIRRHMQLANRDVTEDQLEEILDNPDTPIITQDVLVDAAHWQQVLSGIQTRNEELQVLQTTMQELYDISLTISLMVVEQIPATWRIDPFEKMKLQIGDAIEQISQCIESSRDNVHGGKKTMAIVSGIAPKNRRMKGILVIIILSFIFGVLFLLIIIALIFVAIFTS